VKGKVYRSCIQSVLGYASETWAMKVQDIARLERPEQMMVRWMCVVHLKSRSASADFNSLLGIECITDVLRRSRCLVIWREMVVMIGVSACRSFEVNGVKDRRRGRKTWNECVKKD